MPDEIGHIEGVLAALNQGLYLGQADEVSAVLSNPLNYTATRDAIRKRNESYYKDHPYIANSVEAVGALPTTVALALATGGNSLIGQVASKLPRAWRIPAVGAAEGGVYGGGKSEASISNYRDLGGDILEGAALGATLGAGADVAGKVLPRVVQEAKGLIPVPVAAGVPVKVGKKVDHPQDMTVLQSRLPRSEDERIARSAGREGRRFFDLSFENRKKRQRQSLETREKVAAIRRLRKQREKNKPDEYTRNAESRLADFKKKKADNEAFEKSIANYKKKKIWGKLTDDEKKWVELYQRNPANKYRSPSNDILRSAVLREVKNAARHRGYKIDHISYIGKGAERNISSLYVEIPEVGLFRVSDHYLPDTPQRISNREFSGGASWRGEHIVNSGDDPDTLFDAIIKDYGDDYD